MPESVSPESVSSGGAAQPSCVLFDLDGTLVDTARDLVAPANLLRAEQGLQPLPFDELRNWVSYGAAMVLRRAFSDATDAQRDALLPQFLELYARKICEHSQLFEGLQELLDLLHQRGVPWGIVTNKPGYLTEPLLEALEIQPAPSVVISGDTLAVKKPDPAPVLLACERINCLAQRSIYVGDALRDVQAGLAAGCHTLGVTWGYILADDDPRQWGAHHLADHPAQLREQVLRFVDLA